MGQPKTLEQRSQELQSTFEELLERRHVYYNPPASVRMSYPAIVFNRSNIDKTFANDATYKRSYRYDVTLIDEDPDSKYIEKILELPYCSFDRDFVSENLYHNAFTLYY